LDPTAEHGFGKMSPEPNENGVVRTARAAAEQGPGEDADTKETTARESPVFRGDPSKRAQLLVEYYDDLRKDFAFKPGDIVKWKAGLRNRLLPKYEEPAIVVQVLDRPEFDQSRDAGSTYFREPLDVVLGILDSDGDFSLFHLDRRRFEPYNS
jgi:hypothetical protein